MLSVKNISKQFSNRGSIHHVLRDISFSLSHTTIVSILGPNGCGKTTLLQILAGLEQPSSGTISWNNTTIAKAKSRVGFLFQDPAKSLFPWQTVEEHIIFALKTNARTLSPPCEGGDTPPRRGRGGFAECQKILDTLQLTPHKNKYPYELSGGMMQLLAMGRAWAMRPDIFILDEALSALDYYSTLALQDIFLRLWQERPIPTVIVTHDIDEAIFLSDKILILSPRPGKIIEEISVNIPRPRTFAERTNAEFVNLRKRILERMEGFLAHVE